MRAYRLTRYADLSVVEPFAESRPDALQLSEGSVRPLDSYKIFPRVSILLFNKSEILKRKAQSVKNNDKSELFKIYFRIFSI